MTGGVAVLVFVVDSERHGHEAAFPLLPEKLLESDFLLIDGQDGVRIHSGHPTTDVTAFLALATGLDCHLLKEKRWLLSSVVCRSQWLENTNLHLQCLFIILPKYH